MLLEDVKAAGERLTGIGRARKIVPRARKPHAFFFQDDGETPNNPHFPMILYRSPVRLTGDAATLFEDLFAAHGWDRSWRDSIYPFNHFHTHSHEVLGIARGSVRVRFGGEHGRVIELRAGDVVVQPAGTGHRRLSKSKDLLVVGAYPKGSGGGRYDEPRPDQVDHATAIWSIALVDPPAADPVYGRDGPLKKLWR
jgi:uncharacterized protein YjlB